MPFLRRALMAQSIRRSNKWRGSPSLLESTAERRSFSLVVHRSASVKYDSDLSRWESAVSMSRRALESYNSALSISSFAPTCSHHAEQAFAPSYCHGSVDRCGDGPAYALEPVGRLTRRVEWSEPPLERTPIAEPNAKIRRACRLFPQNNTRCGSSRRMAQTTHETPAANMA